MAWASALEWEVIAVLIGAAILLILLQRLERRRKRTGRAAVFSRCLDLFQAYRITQDAVAYPVLTGKYRGFEVRLEPVIDHMAWRKLPVLWLKATVFVPLPYEGALDLLMRPHGAENFSPSPDLPHHARLPRSWPQEGVLFTDDPQAMPPLESVEPHLGFFADDRMKELVITRKGVRLVARISQAIRANYIAFREIKFPADTVEPQLVRTLLDAAIDISGSLAGTRPMSRPMTKVA